MSDLKFLQFISFDLQGKTYAVDIHEAQEIVKPSADLLSSINIGGQGRALIGKKEIPVFCPESARDDSNQFPHDFRLLILESGGQSAGLLVDSVHEIIFVPSTSVAPVPPQRSRGEIVPVTGRILHDDQAIYQIDTAAIMAATHVRE